MAQLTASSEAALRGLGERYLWKARFVHELNYFLIACGEGRYDFLVTQPLIYVVDVDAAGNVAGEAVTMGARAANVTGDSLAALLEDVAGSLL